MLVSKPLRTLYNQVIEKLCAFGKPEEAEKLLGKVLRTTSNLVVNTCHVLIESYLNKRLPLSANRVTSRMFSRNLIPDLKLCQKETNVGWKVA
ncbi:hypothetical protein HN51_024665 [Arachis hypogaea]|uniref:Uncharacterized protein n=1 Tax=Arachis hypogaea TaxID=3818 RepID=A0A445C7H8_ARAHY|nr:Pentatricopeptide repeat-containing protein family [Arachis hypogaea]RYR46894.1 hypothetical protein Ahy_A07g032757 [Arachis hypogaea]